MSALVYEQTINFKPVPIGIPQGSILGLLLFIIFANTLPESVTCKSVMYADDTTLLCSSDDPDQLQTDLESNLRSIADWFENNHLTLNIKKTKLMIFGTKHVLTNFDNIELNYCGQTIENVNQFKYLGVIFDPNLTWSNHINHVSKNVSKRCGVINRIKYFLPHSTLTTLSPPSYNPLLHLQFRLL